MFDAARAATRIESRLRERARPGRAEAEKRYLKSDLNFLGTAVGAIRTVVRDELARHPGAGRREVIALAEALWAVPVHERRMAAVVVLENRSRMLVAEDLRVVERLLREARTWALIDGLATRVAADVFVAHPRAVQTLDRWAVDDDFWLRRSALLALMRYLKDGGDMDLFSRYADPMLPETEFFVRKAIGWVLREVSKTRPDAVWQWLAPRAGRASGVTVRAAVTHLPAGQRDALLAAYRDRRPARPADSAGPFDVSDAPG